MSDVVYRIVEHDGGWAYKVGDVFSETFPTRRQAESAAAQAAAEQGVPGDDETIEWQDESGRWHEELERGSDRPRATVAGSPTRTGSRRPAGLRAPITVTHLLLAGTAGALIAVLATSKRRLPD